MAEQNTPSQTPSAPASDPNNSTVTPELSESGGTLSFDAARSLSEAFTTIGKPSEEATTPAPQVAAEVAPKAETAAAPEVKSEDPSDPPKTADADTLAEILGGPKKADLKADPDEPSLENATEGANKAFATLRQKWKEEQRRREELESKMADLEKRSTDVAPEEIKQLRETVENYERELQIARVQATKEYKDAVEIPQQRIDGVLASMAKKYEFREADARVAFAEADPDKQTELLVDMASGMNDRDRFKFYELAEEWQKTKVIEGKVVNNAKLALEKIQAHHEEQQKTFLEDRSKQYRKALEKVWTDVSDKAPIFRRREGDEAWNKQIGEVESFATNLDWNVVSGNDQARAELVMRAASAPFLYGLVQNLFATTQDLKKTLGKYQSAKPGAGGGSADPALGTGTSEKPSHEDFLSAIKAGLG
jgi:hypothetical protein